MELAEFDFSTAKSKQHLPEQFEAGDDCLFYGFSTASVEIAGDAMTARIPKPQIFSYVQQIMS
jgi:hypothetical protein